MFKDPFNRWLAFVVGMGVLALGFGLATAFSRKEDPVGIAPPHAPATPMGPVSLAGAGLVEPASELLELALPLEGVVQEVFVEVGQQVRLGQVLMVLEEAPYLAKKMQVEAQLQLAKAKFKALEALPRMESIPPLEAQLARMQHALSQAALLWKNVAPLEGTGAVSEETFFMRKFAYGMAEAQALEVEHQLSLLKAGAWSYELAVAQAEVAVQEAALKAIEIDLSRLALKAPLDGVVLDLNARKGEFANARSHGLVIFGAYPLHVRVDVDAKDAHRWKQEARAYASTRGNPTQRHPLEWVRVDPYIRPKKNLTGLTSELVDTRVLQVIYRLPESAQVWVGQQMDVFME
jgi:HlyD family secretion protein